MPMNLDQEVLTLRREMDDILSRVRSLDTRVMSTEKSIIETGVNIVYIKQSQDKLTAGVSKLLWTVATVFIVGAATWVMSGGLINVTN